MKKVLLRAESRLPRGVFFFSAAGQIIENIKIEPITAEVYPRCYRLCVLASGSWMMDRFSCLTAIKVSCLHFGQYSGKFSRTVSSRIFNRVLLPQKRHNTRSIFPIVMPRVFNAAALYRAKFTSQHSHSNLLLAFQMELHATTSANLDSNIKSSR